MNEIIINKVEVSSLKNEKLKSALLAIQRDCTTVSEKLWKVAEGVHKIITKKLWSEDFKNESELATFMGTSVTTISRLKNAYQAKLDYPEISERGFEPSKVFELLPLKDKINDVIVAENLTADETQKDLREVVKHYKDSKTKKDKNTVCVDAKKESETTGKMPFDEVIIIKKEEGSTVEKKYYVTRGLLEEVIRLIEEEVEKKDGCN